MCLYLSTVFVFGMQGTLAVASFNESKIIAFVVVF